jgi:ATP-binding cassette subfamily B protein
MRFARRRPGYRFLAPEVVQTSAMDCGPASLKCLLEGFGIGISYDRLREACQTDIDGSSIDTLEEVAIELGLDAEQIMLSPEHLLLDEARALPAIVVVRRPNGVSHFVVVWRRHGRWVQIMDPAVGRCWQPISQFLTSLYIHTQTVDAGDWREWAGSEEALPLLRRSLRSLGLPTGGATKLVDEALADGSWHSLAALHAAAGLAASMLRARAVSPGAPAARLLATLFAVARAADENAEPVMSERYRPVAAAGPNHPDHLRFRGAVLVRVRGLRRRPYSATSAAVSAGAGGSLAAELAAAITEPSARPGRDLWRLIRADGLLSPIALAAALFVAASGVVVEAVLFRSLIDVGRDLSLFDQRLAAVAALALFVVALLALEMPIAEGLFRLGRQLEARLRAALFHKLARLDDRYLASRLNSDMAQRCHDAHRLRLLPELGSQLLRACFELLATVAAIAWLDPPSAPLAVAAAACAVGVPLAAQPLLRERDLRVRTHAGAMSRYYLDTLLGLIPICAHGAEHAVRLEHQGLLEEWARAGLGAQRATVVVEGVQSLAGFAFAALLIFTYLDRAGGTGAVLLLLVYWALSLPLLARQIALAARQYPIYRNVTLRLLEPLGAVETAAEETAASPRTAEAAAGVAISIKDVTVRVAGHVILENIDLVIPAGNHVAIIGPSGAGKSTLLGLLLGWHQPSQGRVMVDGRALAPPLIEWLREETAWIDPAVHLWNRTLVDNLLYGAPDGAVALVGRQINEAGLYELLQRLPNGLQTPLGEGGALVSGGEGQRVRFGRAISRPQPRLVLLDEPFSGLERPLRRKLLGRARDLWRGATVLCISHDVEETLAFDRVLVISSGKVVEDGAPSELANQPHSRYCAMLVSEREAQAQFRLARDWRRFRVEHGRVV